jgi:Uma2 family endonuclease
MSAKIAGDRPGPLTVDEFLAFERASTRRHEYVAGRVYMMSGTTARHNRIVTNVFARLRDAAKAPCSVYLIDLKVRASRNHIYYPDAVVVCNPHDGDALLFDNPCFVLEVTSPSTRRLDRGEKVDAYLGMPSLQAYMIVEHDRRHVTCYTRTDAGDWNREEIVGAGGVTLSCPSTTLLIDEIYAGVELPARRIREADDVYDDTLAGEWFDEEVDHPV